MLNKHTIKFVRHILGMEQTELAKTSGISKSMVAAIENGSRSLMQETERKIRKGYGISDELLQRILALYRDIQFERHNRSS